MRSNILINILRSLVWFMIVLTVGLGITFVVADTVAHTQVLNAPTPVLVQDSIGIGSHTLSGVISVPSSCDQMTVHTQQISPSSYLILFDTWREPYIQCAEQGSVREFHVIIFASSLGVSFSATLDGSPIPIAVVPALSQQTSTSTHSTY